MSSYDEYDAEQEEVMHDILEESEEYADNLQRSEDEGWFYPDEDDGEGGDDGDGDDESD
jgi:hypothetical protein